MTEDIIIKESESFYQFSYIEPELNDMGYFVEIDSQSITLYREEWKENRAALPSLGLLKMRTENQRPYYLFGGELLQSRHYSDLKTAVENLIFEAHNKQ